MGGIIDAETALEKNLATVVGLLVVSVGLAALIYGTYTLREGSGLVVLVVGSTLLGSLGAGYLWVSEQESLVG